MSNNQASEKHTYCEERPPLCTYSGPIARDTQNPYLIPAYFSFLPDVGSPNMPYQQPAWKRQKQFRK